MAIEREIKQTLGTHGIKIERMEPYVNGSGRKLRPVESAFSIRMVPLGPNNFLDPVIAQVLEQIKTPLRHVYAVSLAGKPDNNGGAVITGIAEGEDRLSPPNAKRALEIATREGERRYNRPVEFPVEFTSAEIECFPASWSFGWDQQELKEE